MDIDIFWYIKPKTYIKEVSSYNSLTTLKNVVSSCTDCKLSATRNKIVFGEGNENSKVLIIGEAPGKEEDEHGMPFIGRAGKLLNSMLKSINLDRKKVFITNTIKCRPPGNRNPHLDEINACASYLDLQIDLIKPEVIVLLGKVAANRLLDDDMTMSDLRLKKFFIDKYDIPIIVFYHPAYILRSPSKKSKAWEDLKFLNGILKNVS